MKRLSLISSIVGSVVVAGVMMAGVGRAENDWQEHHPGRTHINHRLKHQGKRIDESMKHGKISSSEAQQLHSEDQNIHNQEVQDAKANGGHLTKGERHQLNQEETQVKHQLHEDRHN